MPCLSVVLPTRNSFSEKKGSLAIALRSLELQTCKDFELLIVDNASTDRTRIWLQRYLSRKPPFPVNVLWCSQPGNRARARNVGISHAAAPLVAFLEDDCLFFRDLIEKLVGSYEPGSFCCAARRFWTPIGWDARLILRELEQGRHDYIQGISFLPHGLLRDSGMRDMMEYSFIGNCGVVAKADMLAVAGFDESFSGWGREDVDLIMRLLLKGLRFESLQECVSLVHLAHGLKARECQERLRNRRLFQKREKELDLTFKVNHLFGIYELDGCPEPFWWRPGCSRVRERSNFSYCKGCLGGTFRKSLVKRLGSPIARKSILLPS